MNRAEIQKRYMEKLRADPERYAEHLRKSRERQARVDIDIKREAVKRHREKINANKEPTRKKPTDSERAARRAQWLKEWEEANKERLKERRRKYNIANRERLNQARTKWAKDNPEKRAAISRKYGAANRARITERNRKWIAARPGQATVYTHKYRAIKVNAPGDHHTEEEWQALKSYYMDQCLCCGDVPDELERDHVIPLSMGGSDSIENLQPLCRHCNRSKHTKTTDYR